MSGTMPGLMHTTPISYTAYPLMLPLPPNTKAKPSNVLALFLLVHVKILLYAGPSLPFFSNSLSLCIHLHREILVYILRVLAFS